MNTDTPSATHTALIIPGDHGSLHGSLSLLPDSPCLAVLVHSAIALNPQQSDLAEALRQAGCSTLSVDLVAREEEHFPDLRNNVPLLTKRLLAFLDQIRHRMLMGEIATQALVLYATKDTSPVIIRIASQRDHDIVALVCHGGLIDLAGILYLHTLTSPLLVLHDISDEHHIAANRRALRELRCPNELKIISEKSANDARSTADELIVQEVVHWFVSHLPALSSHSA